jgi:probable F420-dependent oxidoreductase
MPAQLNELGFYTLAGAPESPRDLIHELKAAEELGIGASFISERFNIKEALTLSGAAGAVTEKIGIGTGVTNQNTKHPLVTASHATTMHFLTGGRFSLGLGRGIDMMFDAYGLPRIKTAQMEDFAHLMRRLWRGETVVGHDGPAGTYPLLRLDPSFDEAIPIIMTAFGPNSLALGGRAFDGVILHTFFTDETTQRCVQTIKRSAEKAGRDPGAVRVWSCFATIGDHLDYPLRLKKTVGRMATYLQAYGDLLVKTNNWDPKVLKKFRDNPFVAGFQGAIDQKATTAELELVAELIPEQWLAASATGSPDQCVSAINNQFQLGVDSIILHGASPTEITPIVENYRLQRPEGRFDHLPANPGKSS